MHLTLLISNFEIQGDPNQKLLIQIAIISEISLSETMLVKPECVREHLCQLFVWNLK